MVGTQFVTRQRRLAGPDRVADSAARWGTTIALPPPLVQQLTALKEDQVVALGRNLWRPLRLIPPPPREKAVLGPVRRGD